ncbi:MAG: LysM peptidoglycan-binding domain-containing protein [Clostridia bacterium]|nr:LysM peptidoglycan-binding domain-containing protein [Clostridia bacterium]
MKLTKKGKKCLVFVSVLILLGVFALSQVDVLANKEEVKYISYIVREQDSLWSIAEEFGGEEDIRKTVYEIQKLNGVKSDSLKVGTRLFIPNV